MTRNPMAARASDTLREVLGMLMELDVRHLPVLDEGQLVGIVSDRDLRLVTTPPTDDQATTQRLDQVLSQPVSDFMSSNVVSVDPETDVGEIVDLMLEQKVGAVPVVDTDTTELVGIVSYVDVLRAARDSF